MEYWSDGVRNIQHSSTPISASRSHVDDDHALGLEVIIQSFGAVLAADAALFHAAEGQLVVAIVERVHPHVAGLQFVDRFVGVQ